MEHRFYMPVRLVVGENCIEKNSAYLRDLGTRCLIVTGRTSAKACGALDDVTRALDKEGIEWDVFNKIGPNPLASVCAQGGRAAAAFGADFIIGIGGGSPLDAAKAVAAYAANDMELMDIYKPHKVPALPLVLVGTTAGTGSEVTRYSILTQDETGRKVSWGNDRSYARISFGDPRYTATQSHSTTVSTALDALSHAVESYFLSNSNDFSEAYSLLAIQKILPALQKLRDGAEPDLAMRDDLYIGSIYGGMAIDITGTAFCHFMGYVLTERCNVPHGQACAAYLPDFIDHCTLAAPQKAQRLYTTVNMFAGPLRRLVEDLTDTSFPAFSAKDIDALMPIWSAAKNMPLVPGFSAEKQHEVAMRVLGNGRK